MQLTRPVTHLEAKGQGFAAGSVDTIGKSAERIDSKSRSNNNRPLVAPTTRSMSPMSQRARS